MATRRAQPETPDTDADFEKSARKAPKAAKVPAAKAEKADEVDAEGNPVKKGRTVRGDRNHLARSIDGLLRAADGPVTVRDLAAGITYADGTNPSSGAVAACLKRWAEQGYITINPKPLAFKGFPAKHKSGTLDTFLSKSRDERLTARRAAKAA